MKITEIIIKDTLIPELQAQDKVTVIKELSEAISQAQPGLNAERVAHILLEREKLGSTGIGSGVAIPHGKLPELEHIIASFGRSSKGIDFDSQDGAPTHLFFVLLAPMNSAGTHLKALAKLSRLLKSAEFRNKLLQAQDASELYDIIHEEDEQH